MRKKEQITILAAHKPLVQNPKNVNYEKGYLHQMNNVLKMEGTEVEIEEDEEKMEDTEKTVTYKAL